MTADPRAEDARIVRADAVIYCAGFDNTNEKRIPTGPLRCPKDSPKRSPALRAQR